MAPNTAWSEHLSKNQIQLSSHGVEWKNLVKEFLIKSEIFKEKNPNDVKCPVVDPNTLMDVRHKMAKTHHLCKSLPLPKELTQMVAVKCLREEKSRRLIKQREDKLVKGEIEQLKQKFHNYQLSTKKTKHEIIKEREKYLKKEERESRSDKRYTKFKKRFESCDGFCEVDTWVSRYVKMTMETKIDQEGIPLQVKVRLKRKTEEQSVKEFSVPVSCRKGSLEDELSSRCHRFEDCDWSENIKTWCLNGKYENVKIEEKNESEAKEKKPSKEEGKCVTRSENWENSAGKCKAKGNRVVEVEKICTEIKKHTGNVEQNQGKTMKQIVESKIKKKHLTDREYKALRTLAAEETKEIITSAALCCSKQDEILQDKKVLLENRITDQKKPEMLQQLWNGKSDESKQTDTTIEKHDRRSNLEGNEKDDDLAEYYENGRVVRCRAQEQPCKFAGGKKQGREIGEETFDCDEKLCRFIASSAVSYKNKIEGLKKLLSDNESVTKSNDQDNNIRDFDNWTKRNISSKTDTEKQSEDEDCTKDIKKDFSESKEKEIKFKNRSSLEENYENRQRKSERKEESQRSVNCLKKKKMVATRHEGTNECKMDQNVEDEENRSAGKNFTETKVTPFIKSDILGTKNEEKGFEAREKNKGEKTGGQAMDEYLQEKEDGDENKRRVSVESEKKECKKRTGIGKANHFLITKAWKKWRNYFQTCKKRKKEKAICEGKIETLIKKLQERESLLPKKKAETERKTVISTENPRVADVGTKNEKLKQIIIELKESEKEIRERLSSFEEQQRGAREKLKVLKNLSNDRNFDFLTRMEKRREERISRRNEIMEKRKKMEEERIAREKEKEKELEKREKEEKRRKVEELKQKRRLELEKREEERREKEALGSKLRLAEESYRKHLLRRFGLGPWMALLQSTRLQQYRAALFRDETTLRRSFLAWRQTAAGILRQKEDRARGLYQRALRRRTLRAWAVCRMDRIENLQVAADWFDLRLAERTFKRWRKFALQEHQRRSNQSAAADIRWNESLKRKYLRLWRIFPNIKKVEAAKENRKRVWRQKVLEILPDYNPLDVQVD